VDPMKPKTLGNMAEVLTAWREAGMTKASIKYALGQVYPEDSVDNHGRRTGKASFYGDK